MSSYKATRRRILAGLITALGGSGLAGKAGAALRTPRAAEGPFYPLPSMRKPDIDNDLVKITGLVEKAGGEIITLHGKISDKKGQPLTGYKIEIWQTDMNGKYLHPGDNRNIEFDHGFQGFGHDLTDETGSYRFRTIKPGKYPGRTPHIHVKVFNDKGREVLTTQFYEAGNRENSTDSLFRRMSTQEAESVSMSYKDGSTGLETEINLVV